jgi:hypothetical protein
MLKWSLTIHEYRKNFKRGKSGSAVFQAVCCDDGKKEAIIGERMRSVRSTRCGKCVCGKIAVGLRSKIRQSDLNVCFEKARIEMTTLSSFDWSFAVRAFLLFFPHGRCNKAEIRALAASACPFIKRHSM